MPCGCYGVELVSSSRELSIILIIYQDRLIMYIDTIDMTIYTLPREDFSHDITVDIHCASSPWVSYIRTMSIME